MLSVQLFDAPVNVPHHLGNLFLISGYSSRVSTDRTRHPQELVIDFQLLHFLLKFSYLEFLTLNGTLQFLLVGA